MVTGPRADMVIAEDGMVYTVQAKLPHQAPTVDLVKQRTYIFYLEISEPTARTLNI